MTRFLCTKKKRRRMFKSLFWHLLNRTERETEYAYKSNLFLLIFKTPDVSNALDKPVGPNATLALPNGTQSMHINQTI